jgi:hypothetical protein
MSTTETKSADLGGPLAPTQERMNVAGIAADRLDIPAYDAAMEALITAIPPLVKLDRKTRELKYELGFLILAVRQTFKLDNGEPDTFGTSDAYKRIYGSSIVQRVCKRFPSMEEHDVRALLKDVSENYMRDNDKRKGMGLAYQRIIMDAVESGKIPDATFEQTPDGRLAVTIRPKDKDGNPVLETVTETVTAEDGTETVSTVEVPKEVRYVSGNADAPTEVKTAIKSAVKNRGRKDQKVPQWAGGPDPSDKGKPGRKSDNPVNAVADYAAAWKTMTETIPAVALPTAVQYATAGVTGIIDQAIAAKGEGFNAEALGRAFLQLGNLATAYGRVLVNKDDTKSADLLAKMEEHRYVPETVVVPESTESTENDPADTAAADAAAVEAESKNSK